MNDNRNDVTQDAVDVLAKISQLYFDFGCFKDKFDNSKMYLNLYGPQLIIKSLKTNTEYYLSLDGSEIQLNTHLKYSENLRYMDDSYFLAMLKLKELGRFELINYGSGQREQKYMELFNNNKSSIFILLRQYIINTMEDTQDSSPETLQITWTSKMDFSEIISNGCMAFKILYNLNYDLWKVKDLKAKKIVKKSIID
jgi:hypothetical protein